jgi:Arc/MetJ-type ribon-helix-helix transcriptional regulator
VSRDLGHVLGAPSEPTCASSHLTRPPRHATGLAPEARAFHRTIVRESKVTVKIPRPLYRKVQQVVEGSGFNSPTDFIVYVLRDLMGEAEEEVHEFSQEELDDVKRKLKNLGYL